MIKGARFLHFILYDARQSQINLEYIQILNPIKLKEMQSTVFSSFRSDTSVSNGIIPNIKPQIIAVLQFNLL